jgi:ribose 5-phosphate isomerase A
MKYELIFMDNSTVNHLKEEAAERAVQQLESGMVVGLGSGTTATLAVDAIGKRVKEGLRITGVPTSEKTAAQARELNIPLIELDDTVAIDITIDGADEVETGTLNLIKGGGGNQLREKLVAVASARLLIVVDETKVVRHLGSRFPIPVEVVRFGWQTTAKRLRNLGANPRLRLDANGQAFVTDGGNYILDCAYGPIASPGVLQSQLDSVVGVVEHGLFIGIASQAIVGGTNAVTVLNRDAR